MTLNFVPLLVLCGQTQDTELSLIDFITQFRMDVDTCREFCYVNTTYLVSFCFVTRTSRINALCIIKSVKKITLIHFLLAGECCQFLTTGKNPFKQSSTGARHEAHCNLTENTTPLKIHKICHVSKVSSLRLH